MDRERARLDGELAPRIEDPREPAIPERLLGRDDLDWIDRPAPAGYEPIDMTTFPRGHFFLPALHHPPQRRAYELAWTWESSAASFAACWSSFTTSSAG